MFKQRYSWHTGSYCFEYKLYALPNWDWIKSTQRKTYQLQLCTEANSTPFMYMPGDRVTVTVYNMYTHRVDTTCPCRGTTCGTDTLPWRSPGACCSDWRRACSRHPAHTARRTPPLQQLARPISIKYHISDHHKSGSNTAPVTTTNPARIWVCQPDQLSVIITRINDCNSWYGHSR